MKIGFDAKRLFNNQTGLGNYARTLVQNQKGFFPAHSYHLFSPSMPNKQHTKAFLESASYTRHTSKSVSKLWWRSIGILGDIDRNKLDIYHGLSHELPIGIKNKRVRTVVSIHDLIFKALPDTFPKIDRWIYDQKFKYSCQVADRILAISESTKLDIVKYYKINPDNIEVVYQSCDPLFYELQNKETVDKRLKRHGIPKDYFLSVGRLEKRKNLDLIIQAYRILKENERIPIVIVGKGKANFIQEKKEKIKKLGLGASFVFLENIHDNLTLQALYQNSLALIYPSLYEGFGLPVVEAFLSKTAVITSNVSSLPEAGGEGALLIDPNNAESLANGIQSLLSDEKRRIDLIQKGHNYASEKFSPERTSNALHKLYLDLLET